MKLTYVVIVAACNPIKIPSSDAVASDPNRMRELMRQCKVEWAKVGDATCRAASEAWRRRFMGSGKEQNPASSGDEPS